MFPRELLPQLNGIEWYLADNAPREEAAEVIKAKPRAVEVREPAIEMAWAIESPQPQLQRAFVILCARYGVTQYRRRRQRTSTFNIKVPRSWGEESLPPRV